MNRNYALETAQFIKKSPTAFHAVAAVKDILNHAGFTELTEESVWSVSAGGSYYTERNGSSVIAFKIGKDASADSLSFNIAASHSDSPLFKIKENAEITVNSAYTKLNTEGYGGMLCAPWLDRPLSIAGRAMVKDASADGAVSYKVRLVNIDRDLCLIPNVAIHMNREANDGMKYNKQVDMLPLISGKPAEPGLVKAIVAKELGVEPADILGSDLFVYNRQDASVWGADEEFISAPRLDDLQCAYTTLAAFLQAGNDKTVQVYACFDNEEVGSSTKQGAASSFLEDVTDRIGQALGMTREDMFRAMTGSFLLSCDNAHAVHPNHPEKTDAANCCYINKGIVIKSNAAQKYTSDAVSIGIFKGMCENAGVPVQYFANRSDSAGGSTLGNIAVTRVSMNSVDIGLPQLAMHSPFETAGTCDCEYMVRAAAEFYASRIIKNGDSFTVSK